MMTPWLPLALLIALAIMAFGAAVIFWRQAQQIRGDLDAERARGSLLLQDLKKQGESWQKFEEDRQRLDAALSAATAARDAATEQVESLKREVARRPTFKSQAYRIVVIGLPKSGKTSLTLKWANPLWELRNVQGTSFDQYRRTVSSMVLPRSNTFVSHDFEVYDYGGERMVDAQNTLVVEEVHGLLFVVDLAPAGSEVVDDAHIQRQLDEFRPQTLQFFLRAPRVTRTCRTVVLFINKSDLISARAVEAERIARQKFQPLIDTLDSFADHIEVEVIVGSAVSGHNTHLLMPHFIQKLLPSDAYDNQLLQQQRDAS